MNENLNLVEILKDCPRGTKLYSTIFGEVIFDNVSIDKAHPIVIRLKDRRGYDALAWATYRGFLPICEYLFLPPGK